MKDGCENKYFHAEVDTKQKPFTTVMPPPNITGKLHMGHALDNTLQDILIRYKRMEGTMHSGSRERIMRQSPQSERLPNQLKEEGIDKKELGREDS